MKETMANVLLSLTNSKEQITKTRQFVLQNASSINPILDAVDERATVLTDRSDLIAIVYLINDILYQAARSQRAPGKLSPVTRSVLLRVLRLFKGIHDALPPKDAAHVLQVVAVWARKEIFSASIVDSIQQHVSGAVDMDLGDWTRFVFSLP